jgi:hypothetical protein
VGSGGSTVGWQRWSFFLKAEVGNDAFDAAGTDDPAGLAEFLGNDRGGSFGIEEAMANDLADDFVGTAVVAFWAAFMALQGQGAAVGESLSQLEIALFAETELLGGTERSEFLALAFQEHGEFAGDFIVVQDAERTLGPDELLELEIELKHARPPEGEEGSGDVQERIARRGIKSN